MLKATDMKLIKIVALVIITYLVAIGLAQGQNQQQVAVPLSDPGEPGFLNVEMVRGSIKIEGYDGQEVVIRIDSKGKKLSKNKGKDGMRKISGPSYGVEVSEKDNNIDVGVSPSNQASHLEIMVPASFSVNASTVNEGNIEVRGLTGELEISNVNGSIRLEEIRGSAVASTVNGDVVVRFREVAPDTPMAFSSLNGDIDVTFPASIKVDAQMKTLNGDIFTDFEMDISSGSNVDKRRENGVYKVTVDKSISGTINGGGPKVIFKNHNGNIYIRKI